MFILEDVQKCRSEKEKNSSGSQGAAKYVKPQVFLHCFSTMNLFN
jgi:hypothetical protein